MELIDLIAGSVVNMKFDLLSSLSSASETINFWRPLPCEHFLELKKFAQSYACRFGITYRCEQASSSMKSIINKLSSQLSDSNVMKGVLRSVTNFTPNIADMLKEKKYQWSH